MKNNMTSENIVRTGIQLLSKIDADGSLKVYFEEKNYPAPQGNEVLVEIGATPINPSDVGAMFGPVDPSSLCYEGAGKGGVLTGTIPEKALKNLKGRLGKAMPVGLEGAGVVVAAGKECEYMLGRTVAILGVGNYTQFRMVTTDNCLLLPEGTRPDEGASCFTNPLSVLCMIETMRREGHSALVHAAAASNLGKMLVRVCIEEGINLVNIVRCKEQEQQLRRLGSKWVCNSSDPNFDEQLTAAITESGATIAFDPIGGGTLACQILAAMEKGASQQQPFSRYGSTTLKQVYIFASLDRSPTIIDRTFGMAWQVGGWLMTSCLERFGEKQTNDMKRTIASGLKTTFSSSYGKTVSLTDVIKINNVLGMMERATGKKVLIVPKA